MKAERQVTLTLSQTEAQRLAHFLNTVFPSDIDNKTIDWTLIGELRTELNNAAYGDNRA